MLGIINYGMGNLASVQNALEYLQIPNRLISEPKEICMCDKVILPGVGAFGEAMDKITKSGYLMELQEFVTIKQRPILGICLGMQLLLDSSVEFGSFSGLSFIAGSVESLADHIHDLPIPHVGWNDITITAKSLLLDDIAESSMNFYFVHSFYCRLKERSVVTGQVSYGFNFDVMFEKENIFGVQFHPEKSQKSGLRLLHNFGKL